MAEDTSYINELQHNLIEAMDIIAGAKVSEMKFDRTLICTIEDNEKAARGEYVVCNGGSTFFTAYSVNTDYEEGQKVYVSIPNGDMNAQKMIVGKYMDEGENQYFTYSHPMKSFVNITGNLIPDEREFTLLANAPSEVSKKMLYSIPIENGKRYDRLGISADFKTWLRGFRTSFGSYGLEIDVTTINPQVSTSPDVVKKFKYILDCTEFYGNPYNFETYYTQEKVIDISKLDTITNITVYAYQNRDFLNNLRQPIPYQEQVEDGSYKILPHNIFFSKINIGLGYDKINFDGDALLLYTLNGDTYSDDITNAQVAAKRKKQLHLRWIHADENNVMNVIEDEESIPAGAEIHWYHYKLYEGVEDELAGAFWEEIFPGANDDLFNITITPAFGVNSEKYKVIVENPSRKSIYLNKYPLDDNFIAYPKGDPAYLNNELDYLYKKWMALIDNSEYRDEDKEEIEKEIAAAEKEYTEALGSYDATQQVIESNILTLVNEKPVADAATVTLIQGLKIKCDEEGYKGVYRLYTHIGEIKNQSESYQLRKMVASYRTLVSGESALDTAEKIIWKIPIQNTMIEHPQNGKEYNTDLPGVSYREEDGYAIITRDSSFPRDTSIGDFVDSKTEQTFRIKNYLVQTATNNRVYCEVVKNNITYEAYTDMFFGPAGTNGTNYTFVVEPDPSTPFLIINEPEKIMKIKCSLFNYENQEMRGFNDEPCNGYQITYNWYSRDEDAKIGFCDANGNFISEDTYGPSLTPPCLKFLTNYKGVNQTEIDKIRIELEEDLSNINIDDYSNLEEYDAEVERVTKYHEERMNSYNVDNDNIYSELDYPHYYILQASLYNEDAELGKRILLTALLPIAISRDKYYAGIEGTTKIIYNSLGTNPYYYEQPYKLYANENKKEMHEIEDSSWMIFYDDDKEDAKAYYPEVDLDGMLKPKNIHIEGLSRRVCVMGYDDSKDGILAWIQPIIIQKDGYSSTLINSWDGNLTFNKENGTILSAMVGAGVKNEDNSFDGVLMGNVNLAYDEISRSKIGVYGFNRGEASFGLLIDGTAFLGKKGRGQILFDGNNGTIQSASYKESNGISAGMKIDLDDGIIDIRGVRRAWDWNKEDVSEDDYIISGDVQSHIKISSISPYLTIDDEVGNRLMYVGGIDESYYLQTSNFDVSNRTGVRFDLKNGYLTGYDFTFSALDGSGENGVVISSDGTPYLDVMSNGVDLIYATKNGCWIKSQDESTYFDLSGSAFRIGKDGNDSEIYMSLDSSGNAEFRFGNMNKTGLYLSSDVDGDILLLRYKTDNYNNILAKINYSQSAYYIRSRDYATVDINYKPLGTQMDFWRGDLISCSLTLIGVSDQLTSQYFSESQARDHLRGYSNWINGSDFKKYIREAATCYKSILIDSGASTYPFKIGENFKISWNGAMRVGDNYAFQVDSDGSVQCYDLNIQRGGTKALRIGNYYYYRRKLVVGENTYYVLMSSAEKASDD